VIIAQHLYSLKYIATKNLRNIGVTEVVNKEDAQKFASKGKAIDLIHSWGLDVNDYELVSFYYPSQEGYTLK
jgi:hypothetical protein